MQGERQFGITISTKLSLDTLRHASITEEERQDVADLLDIAFLKHAQATREDEHAYLLVQTKDLEAALRATAPGSERLITEAIQAFNTIVKIYKAANEIASEKRLEEIKKRKIVREAATNLASTLH